MEPPGTTRSDDVTGTAPSRPFGLDLTRVVVDGRSQPLTEPGTARCGPVAVTLEGPDRERGWRWSASAHDSIALRSVAVVFRVLAPRPVQFLRHGYQSWSSSDTAVFEFDHDPSFAAGEDLPPLAHGCFNADERPVHDPDELRSELVAVVLGGWGFDAAAVFVAFTEVGDHDGTIRLRPHPLGGVELWVEAFLGGVDLQPGEARALQPFVIEKIQRDGALDRIDQWCVDVGRRAGARVDAPHLAVWSSWYHYFTEITESDVLANLTEIERGWAIDVVQIDDGYQSAIGDWLTTNDTFPSGLAPLADRIRRSGRRAGLWLAPFLVAPDSRTAQEHPDWLARQPDGSPLLAMFNPVWDGGLGGLMYGLDTTNPDVLDHLEGIAASLRRFGFTFLKLDFTFAPSLDGVWMDRRRTPLQRVRDGYDAVRRGAGEDTFVLACGAPLSAVVGVADAVRIGPDVTPSWDVHVPSLGDADQGPPPLPGYERSAPSTRNAVASVLARSFFHRRFWMNDPDCVMLRRASTSLDREQIATWSRLVGASGGLVSISDDLTSLDDHDRATFASIVDAARASDARARSGDVPRCPDLLSPDGCRELLSGGRALIIDVVTGTSLDVTAPT